MATAPGEEEGGHGEKGDDEDDGPPGIGQDVGRGGEPQKIGDKQYAQRLAKGISPVGQLLEQQEGGREGDQAQELNRDKPDKCIDQEDSASTKVCASKGARSSRASPVPMNRMGIFSSSQMASTIPPLAVPSSLARKIPVTPTASVKYLA